MEQLNLKKQKIFKSLPFKCSYISSKNEQRLIIKLDKGHNNQNHFDSLMKKGFRRNMDHMYFPICENCSSCISSRVKINGFSYSKSQKRNIKKNQSFLFVKKTLSKDVERYTIFKKYTENRHSDGLMKSMTFNEFLNFVNKSPVNSTLYDLVDSKNKILGSMLFDTVDHGLSAVYSFYDPEFIKNGLGTYMILKAIEMTGYLNLGYLYLGYWIKESKKMNYKASFNNLEIFENGKWNFMNKVK